MTVNTVDTLVIGAGHAGLAVSRLLAGAGRDHVVLDRGGIGERWRSERWDSLHLLTPNWMTRLPGWYYGGPDPDGYLSAAQFRRSLLRYAESFGAPVVGGTTVRRLVAADTGDYDVHTDRGTWRAGSVVVATGPHGAQRVPDGLARTDLTVVPSSRYRNPATLPPGGVLVVGASSSGVQIADELARAGRDVVLAVGRHTRMPRRYRGMDVFWWMDRTGRLGRTIDAVPDPEVARREPSLQLVGRNHPEHAGQDLDLAALQRHGVRLQGRFLGLAGHVASFADDLHRSVATADAALHRFLDSVDRHVERMRIARELFPALRPAPFRPPSPPRSLDLRAEGVGSVVVATGFRPDHSWLRLPITDSTGSVRQHRGVTPAPGVYVVGQRFQHRRDSGFIDGARHDARAVVGHLITGSFEPAAREEPAA